MIRFSTKAPHLVLFQKDEAPFGPVLLGFTEEGVLCRLAFLARTTKAATLKKWSAAWPKTRFVAAEKPSSLFAPEAPAPDILLVGTPFRQNVWKALLKISAGKTDTYSGLASKAGFPKATRAVGGALGANPVPFFVPCHRILAKDGTLGGYSGGLTIKKRLLSLEGITAG